MKISAKFLAFAGLAIASSVEGAAVRDGPVATERRLEDDLCGMCDLCDILSPLCDDNAIADFACDLCDLLGDDDPDDDDDGDDSDVCFSEVATVQVLQQDMTEAAVPMKDLQVGYQILTGKNQYETVYAFGHHHPTKLAAFYQLYNENSESPLEVTADHLVFLQDKQDPVAASTIQVGDVLSSPMGASKVTKVGSVERNGIYAPLTTGGKLLVDGVMASSYISLGKEHSVVSDHALIHMTLSPYRMVCRGISSRFCDTNSYDEDGMPHYVQYGLSLLHWMNSSSAIIQAVALTVIVAATGTLFAWELLFGACLAPLMAFLAALAYSSYQTSNKSKAKVL